MGIRIELNISIFIIPLNRNNLNPLVPGAPPGAQMAFRRPRPCNCRYTLFLFFSLKPTKLPIQRHQKQQNRLRIQGYRRKKERKNQFFWKMPETTHVGLTWGRVEQPEIRERTSNFRKLSWTNVYKRLKKLFSF